jgi:hypothetical protein
MSACQRVGALGLGAFPAYLSFQQQAAKIHRRFARAKLQAEGIATAPAGASSSPMRLKLSALLNDSRSNHPSPGSFAIVSSIRRATFSPSEPRKI